MEMTAPIFKKQLFGKKKLENMIKRLDSKEIPYFIREGSECTEIILNDTLFVFTSIENFPRNKLFLFSSVMRDVKKFVFNKGFLELPPEFPVTKFNVDYPYDKSIGIDINHAYWRIAFIKGIISQKTYENGLTGDCKALRLSTLSVLGRERKFTSKNDEVETTFYKRKADPELQKIFKYIRFVCYDMMNSVANKLGEDFDCWKTDCVYFHDTIENRKIVTDFFDRKQMTYKILDYFENTKSKKQKK